MRTWSPSSGAVAKIFVPTRNEVRSKCGDSDVAGRRRASSTHVVEVHARPHGPCQQVGEVGRAGDDVRRRPRLEGRRVLRTGQHADDEGGAGVGAGLEVAQGVTGDDDVTGIGHAGQRHRLLDHPRRRSPGADLLGGDEAVDRRPDRPPESPRPARAPPGPGTPS